MWIVTLPEEFSSEVEALACQFPTSWTLTSPDLQRQCATLEWHTVSHRIVADANNLWNLGSEPTVVAIVTPSRTAISTLTFDEPFLQDVFYRRYVCGHEYHAEDHYNKEELDAAMTRSVLLGSQPMVDEDGLTVLKLDTKTYS